MHLTSTAVAKEVYTRLEALGVQNLSDKDLYAGQINVLSYEQKRYLCFYTVSNFDEDLDLYNLYWAEYDYGQEISKRCTRSDLRADEASVEEVMYFVTARLRFHGINLDQREFKPRTVYPEGEQQELCL